MWRGRSHLLAPLARLTSKKVKFEWTDVEQTSFDEVKKILSREVMLAFPNFSKPFVIHTDASNLQLGSVISQDDKPIAFYSRKLNDAQTRYTTTEQELLSIVETLKEFRNILLGQEIVIYTDHQNLTYKKFNTDRVLRWRLIIEEFNAELKHIAGTSNVVADALSRLPKLPDFSLPVKPTAAESAERFDLEALPQDLFPLDMTLIQTEQKKDRQLLDNMRKDRELPQSKRAYSFKSFRGRDNIITQNGKIYIPKSLRKQTVQWYHDTLRHCGETRLENTLRLHLTWPGLKTAVHNKCKTCHACQTCKRQRKKYGHLPPKEAESQPWEILCVDLIGTYTVRRKGKKDLTLQCCTMTDPATGWFEIVRTTTKSADVIANLVEQAWLTRYPWPTKILYDHGGEFLGKEFQELIQKEYDIKAKPITVKNPQSNAMLERVHQTIGNMLRTYELENFEFDEDDPWSGILSAIAWAIRSTVHTTTKATAGQLVYGRDMMYNIPYVADWHRIKESKTKEILKNNRTENSKRIPYDYVPGD